MTEEEKAKKVREMQNFAKQYNEDRNMKLFGTKEIESLKLTEVEPEEKP